MAIFKHEPSPVPEGMEPCEVPLIEQLRSVPKNYMMCAPIQWDEAGNETGHRFIPVGLMMHRAAEELAELESPQEGHCNSCDTWRLCELHMKCLTPPKSAENSGKTQLSPNRLLRVALAEFCEAFTNRGETTPLHEWNNRMKAAHANALEALAGRLPYAAPRSKS